MNIKLMTLLLILAQSSIFDIFSSEINDIHMHNNNNNISNTNSILSLQNTDNNKLNILNECINYLQKQDYNLNLQKLSKIELYNLQQFNREINMLFSDAENLESNSSNTDSINNVIEDDNSINDNHVINSSDDSIDCLNINKLINGNPSFSELIVQQSCSDNSDKLIIKTLIEKILNSDLSVAFCDIISLLNNNKYIPYIINIIHINFYQSVISNLKEYITNHQNNYGVTNSTITNIVAFFTNEYSDAQCLDDDVIRNSFRRSYIENVILQYNEDFENATDATTDIPANNDDKFAINYITTHCIEVYQGNYSEYLRTVIQDISKYLKENNNFLNKKNQYYKNNINYIKDLIEQCYITNPHVIDFMAKKYAITCDEKDSKTIN